MYGGKGLTQMWPCTTILSLGTMKNPSKSGQQSSNSRKTGLADLGSKYANNFQNDEMTASVVNIEALFIQCMFKKLVSKMTEKLSWLKASDNSALYNDCRGFINHVKINYGSIFRRVALSGLMDSTKKLVKTQYKVDAGHHLTRYLSAPFLLILTSLCHIFICYIVLLFSAFYYRIPAGSYTNIESRDSPVGGSCNYVDETAGVSGSEPKLIYKKSVFKKKSTSSTATVRFQLVQLFSSFNIFLYFVCFLCFPGFSTSFPQFVYFLSFPGFFFGQKVFQILPMFIRRITWKPNDF